MTRQEIEIEIAKRFIAGALAAGYAVSVHDGEEETVDRSTDAEAILEAMFTTDSDTLFVHHIADAASFQAKAFGCAWFIYGNDGYDVIADHSANLEALVHEATKEFNQTTPVEDAR